MDPKKPSMKVSSFAKVERLNADLLDGKSTDQSANGVGGTAVDSDYLDGKESTAFFSEKTYMVSERKGPGSSFGMEKALVVIKVTRFLAANLSRLQRTISFSTHLLRRALRNAGRS